MSWLRARRTLDGGAEPGRDDYLWNPADPRSFEVRRRAGLFAAAGLPAIESRSILDLERGGLAALPADVIPCALPSLPLLRLARGRPFAAVVLTAAGAFSSDGRVSTAGVAETSAASNDAPPAAEPLREIEGRAASSPPPALPTRAPIRSRRSAPRTNTCRP